MIYTEFWMIYFGQPPNKADNIPSSYWRKRKNIPKNPAQVQIEDIYQLGQAISKYFHNKEGRGKIAGLNAIGGII